MTCAPDRRHAVLAISRHWRVDRRSEPPVEHLHITAIAGISERTVPDRIDEEAWVDQVRQAQFSPDGLGEMAIGCHTAQSGASELEEG
jgi:hypothetical protein